MNTALGIIGAAAWVPHIITWLHKLIAKPKLRFVPQDIIQIGYLLQGPVLIETFAIKTSGKDALIEKIKATVVHESGDKHEFYWKFLTEMGPQITTTSGDITAKLSKMQAAIALPVSVVGLAERTILFQDTDYEKRLNSLHARLKEKATHLEKTQREKYKQEIDKTEELQKVLDFIKREFYWKQGKYDIFLNVHETSLKKSHPEHFGFELASADIEQLERNIEETQNFFKDLIIYKDSKPEEIPRRIWNWVYPSFYRR